MNSTATPRSPVQPVKELGRVLLRLFDSPAAVPPHEVVHLAKIDLSDTFWRMLEVEFCVCPARCMDGSHTHGHTACLADGMDREPRILLCATTETKRDVIQSIVVAKEELPPHAMESFMTPVLPACRQSVSPLED